MPKFEKVVKLILSIEKLQNQSKMKTIRVFPAHQDSTHKKVLHLSL
jgi:hypothetical protein